MRMFFIVTLIAAIVIAKPNTAHCGIGVIGLDNVHGHTYSSEASLATGADFVAMRSILESQGRTLKPLGDFSASSLADVDCVFIRQAGHPSSLFTTDDITNLHAFVAAGGSMVAIAEGGLSTSYTVDNFNQLLTPYGVTVNESATDGDGRTVTGFVSHPITQGVASIGLDYQRFLTTLGAPAIDLTFGNDNDEILAVVEGIGGAGSVVILSDSSLFCNAPRADNDIYDYDNKRLLSNITNYLIIPEPHTLVMSVWIGMSIVLRRYH